MTLINFHLKPFFSTQVKFFFKSEKIRNYWHWHITRTSFAYLLSLKISLVLFLVNYLKGQDAYLVKTGSYTPPPDGMSTHIALSHDYFTVALALGTSIQLYNATTQELGEELTDVHQGECLYFMFYMTVYSATLRWVVGLLATFVCLYCADTWANFIRIHESSYYNTAFTLEQIYSNRESSY